MKTPTTAARRPLKSRETSWAKNLSRTMAHSGISPNMISFMSMVFALLSLIFAYLAAKDSSRVFIILSALSMQLRLICNLMDGMVAVEFGKKSKTGDLWNDAPDRIADVFIIVGAAFLCGALPYARDLAWANGALAIMTAYIRVLGASLKSPHYYFGPMAKPQRMAILTVAFVIEAIYPTGYAAYGALVMMLVLQIVTCVRRLNKIAVDLETK